MTEPAYLDYNATTPIAPEVVDAMLPYLREHYGNPSSGHLYGKRAAEGILRARGEVADLIGADADEILFTGCATEANNLAIRGVARALRDKGRHVITSAVEHPSVTMPFKRLEEEGWAVTELPVDEFGQVRPADLQQALRPDTTLVSVMHANNEVGTIQPVTELARIAHAHGALFHTDAAQSAGKISVVVDDLGVDLLTLAGHKFYAPKGVGALYVRSGTPILPLLAGAGHERGLRPGTENTPHIIAIGAAARLSREGLQRHAVHLIRLRDRLHRRLAEVIPELVLNGHPEARLPNTLNVSFPKVSGAALLEAAAADVAASTGSACHTEGDTPSGVLGAMGATAAQARGAVRLSIGIMTSEDDVDRAAAGLVTACSNV
ncbi:cysteine desulfurase family protein [Thiohalomonas denitrificans]|uniref:cysteine desulfurase n=1 Tax=Thiohalomonas denitrificans TaxID=415747 RepID=A0A1G5QAC0_9GAMM|nr:cysteine desulfurase family protein [Thiohalomonas denitrificans]SCZ58321.1 cysteine desulfurase [Thiohalomonas denitrificans]